MAALAGLLTVSVRVFIVVGVQTIMLTTRCLADEVANTKRMPNLYLKAANRNSLLIETWFLEAS